MTVAILYLTPGRSFRRQRLKISNPKKLFPKPYGPALGNSHRDTRVLGAATTPRNEAANAALKKDLVESGYEPHDVEGQYNGIDQGKNYLVLARAARGDRTGSNRKAYRVLKGLILPDGTVLPVDPSKTVVGT